MYYTPTLDEFHCGFECEIFENDEWHKCTLGYRKSKIAQLRGMLQASVGSFGQTITIDSDTLMTNLRVRFLSAKDLQSLGFTPIGNFQCVFEGYEHQIKLYETGNSAPTVQIVDKEDSDCFYGQVRNISEFKRILRQIGVPYVVEEEIPFTLLGTVNAPSTFETAN
jgi:Cys-tRNA synthase (O-phospho-L-seryl-tRNA:Cys-tRNA synthase)